jgi:hypothetical protein
VLADLVMEVMHSRPDGSFVIRHRGYPYHVTADDPLFAAVSAAAQGREFPAEPEPIAVAAPREVLPLAWMDRLHPSQQLAVCAAAITEPQIFLWLLRLTAARVVDLDAEETADGVAALVDAEVLTPEDAAALLA